jgi:hypothetical protein
MRALAALSAVVSLFALGASLLADEFPYTVTAADRAPLRAAASETNEPTAYLAAGTQLEVYRRDGNFLAVRPPEGSFSWVRASDARPTGDADVVRVAASGAQAWVGHQGTDLRAISQVALQEGEKLRVLGTVAASGNPAQIAWYQVAPPAGEFRFVLAQHVAAAAPVEPPVQPASVTITTTPSPPSTAPLTAALGLNVNVMPSAAADPVAERLKQIDAQLAAMLAQSPSTWNTTALYGELQSLTSTAPTAELRTQAQNLWWRVAKCQEVQRGYTQIATPQLAPPLPVQTPIAAQASYAAPVSPTVAQPAEFIAQQPQPQATVPPWINRVRQMAGNLSTTMQQQQQQRTYTSSLRNRAASSVQQVSAVEPTADATAQSTAGERPAAAGAEASTYAGSGWLMPLVNRSELQRDTRSGVPPFALTDDAGNVKFLVTPTPGLSVSEYARKQVGILGPVGKLPNLSNPHITAQRVVVLERLD